MASTFFMQSRCDHVLKRGPVVVHYTGTLEDGTKFDSSVDRGDPFEFTLGHSQVIKGWDIGVATMKKGEKVQLKLRQDYAYGESGSPPTIPPGATLVGPRLVSCVSLVPCCDIMRCISITLSVHCTAF